MPLVQVIIDRTTSMVIEGVYDFQRGDGGTLIAPAGPSFPGTPVAGEWFWRTDESKLYRRNDTNDAWIEVSAAVQAHAATHEHGGSDEIATATSTANAIPKAAASGKLDIGWIPTGNTSTTVCVGNDPRLSDARTPIAHAASHKGDGADAIAVATHLVAGLESAEDKTKLDGIAVGATNTPLSNIAPINVTKATSSAGVAAEASRQDHKHDIATAAPGAVGVASISGEGSSTSLARSDHTHQSNTVPANVTKTAALVGTSGEPARADHKHDVSTASAGAATPGDTASEGTATTLARSDHRHSLPGFGSSAGTFCQGNDPRLSDARTPTAHAVSHQSGGTDSIKLDDLAAPDDNTDLNASTSAHGLLRKLSGDASTFLNGQGDWAAPSGSIFGADYQIEVSEGTSTTTSATMQDKVTLTTPALTGTYRVSFFCEIMIGAANTRHRCRLYNVTDVEELCFDDSRPSLAGMYTAREGFQNVTFAGAAKTFKIQFASQNGSSTVTIRRARIELWRVS